MYESVLEKVLRAYKLKYKEIYAYEKGYRNEIWPVRMSDDRLINVTFYKREDGIIDRIKRADAVSEFLSERGMPTRQRIDPRVLQLKNSIGSTSVGVYTYLPGKTIPWEAYTMTHLKLLGKAMSDMHALLADAPHDNLPSVYDEYFIIIQRMRRYFAQAAVKKAIKHKLRLAVEIDELNSCAEVLKQCKASSRQQVLHMDFVRGNILFSEAAPTSPEQLEGLAISGILDFEKTALGNPIVDIARTLAFLLVDCKYKSAIKVEKYFLYSGYQKRGRGGDISDIAWLNDLVELFLLYDFYKFLRHNPYESLQLNEHYLRTRNMLLERNVLRYI